MMVTRERADLLQTGFDESQRRSIEIAVAQYLRSRRGVALARKALLDLGVSEDEIVRRRRAESSDDELARILRLAVTIVITRGRLTDGERSKILRSFSEKTWNAIVEATTDAYKAVIRAEIDPATVAESTLNMEIGDY